MWIREVIVLRSEAMPVGARRIHDDHLGTRSRRRATRRCRISTAYGPLVANDCDEVFRDFLGKPYGHVVAVPPLSRAAAALCVHLTGVRDQSDGGGARRKIRTGQMDLRYAGYLANRAAGTLTWTVVYETRSETRAFATSDGGAGEEMGLKEGRGKITGMRPQTLTTTALVD